MSGKVWNGGEAPEDDGHDDDGDGDNLDDDASGHHHHTLLGCSPTPLRARAH